MPHVVVEYTANLGEQARIPELLQRINRHLNAQDSMFPTGGIRSRAIELQHWCIADGSNNEDAFVHLSVRIGRGRSAEDLKRVFDGLFEQLKTHYADTWDKRGMALSMEVNEFSEAGTWKHNNLHARYRKA